MAGISTLSSAIIVNNDWVKEPRNQDRLRRFLAASQRGWDYTRQHPDEAAALFIKHAPAFNTEIALLEINGTLTITNTKHTEGKPLFWSAKEDWQESQDLLEKYAGLTAQPDLGQVLHQRISWRSRRTRTGQAIARDIPALRGIPRGAGFPLRDLTVETCRQ